VKASRKFIAIKDNFSQEVIMSKGLIRVVVFRSFIFEYNIDKNPKGGRHNGR